MVRRSLSWVAIETKFILEGMLRRGFTTVRDAGGLDAGITSALDRGLIKGPRVFRSGRVISQTGGHGDLEPVSHHPQLCACAIRTTAFSHIADGADAVRRAVREELKAGAHHIKIMAGGGVATPYDPIDMVQYTADEMRAAVEEASARRTYVSAHAYIPESITRAVTAGVRTIEHGNLIDEAAARVMAERGAYLVPTLVTYDQIAELGKSLKFPEESLRKLGDVLDRGLRGGRHRAARRRQGGLRHRSPRRNPSGAEQGVSAAREGPEQCGRAARRDHRQRRDRPASRASSASSRRARSPICSSSTAIRSTTSPC